MHSSCLYDSNEVPKMETTVNKYILEDRKCNPYSIQSGKIEENKTTKHFLRNSNILYFAISSFKLCSHSNLNKESLL